MRPNKAKEQPGPVGETGQDAEISDSGGEHFGGEQGASQVAQW